MVHKPRRNHDAPSEDDILNAADARLEILARNLLATSGQVDASRVQVTSTGRSITLSGQVSRLEEVERCSRIVMSIKGVDDVINRLTL